jgi:hypothetical protein
MLWIPAFAGMTDLPTFYEIIKFAGEEILAASRIQQALQLCTNQSKYVVI